MSILNLIVLLLLSTSFKVVAGSVDLSVASSYSSANDLTAGDRVKFSVSAINNGPDTTGTGASTGFPLVFSTSGIELREDGTDIVFYLDESIPQPCFLGAVIGSPLPGQLPTISYGYVHPPIQPSEMGTCYGEFQVFESTKVDITARSIGDTDPDFSDNTLFLRFGLLPQQVPTVSLLSVIVMALILFLLGLLQNLNLINGSKN